MTIYPATISALVLHFRSPEPTLQCLRSLSQEGIRNAVLVDNSEDSGRSIDIMASALTKLRRSGMSIQVVDPAQNLGFAKGVNLGLSRANVNNTTAILLINSDAIVEAGSVARLASGLQNADIVIPRVCDNTGASRSLFNYYCAMTSLLIKKPCQKSLKYASGCCMLVRSNIARGALFDEDFFFYGEDVALSSELLKVGAKIIEEKAALIQHSGSESSKNGSLFYEYHINRGHWLLAKKLARNSFEKNLYLTCRCVVLPLRASIRCWRLKSLTPLLGFITASVDLIRGQFRSFTPPPKSEK
ncbi:glycosyltransferase family 2 protein [Marinobacter sp. W-8]|uniref:glycosyltransferase family 2 protein n=1 Tax=Marinobacter sp. W-8 TaxID=3369658 RepID=UPI0037C538FB